jgi:hypothetical protein
LQIKGTSRNDEKLKKLFNLVYGKVCKATEVKGNLLKFSGLTYENEATDKPKYETKLAKWSLALLRDCMDLCSVRL